MLWLLHLTDLSYLKSIKPRKLYILLVWVWSTGGWRGLKISYERSFVPSTLHLSPQRSSWLYIHRSAPALVSEWTEWKMQPLRSGDLCIHSADFTQAVAALQQYSFSLLYLSLTGSTSWSRNSFSVPTESLISLSHVAEQLSSSRSCDRLFF